MKLYPNVITIFLIWLSCTLFIMYSGFLIFPHSSNFEGNFIESLSGNWDGGHFRNIAQFGYTEKSQYAFFPLYPMAIRLINQIFQNYLFSQLFVSIVSSFLAINLAYKMFLGDFGKMMAEKIILMLLFFPASFYLLTGYSEGLFLLLVISTFYFMKKNNLMAATIFCVLASATRLAGLVLVAGFWIGIQSNVGINKKNWYVIFAPAGFILYCLYLYFQTSDPLYFVTSEANWQRTLSVPGLSFWETIRNLSKSGEIAQNFNALLDLMFAIFGVGMVLRTFRFLPPSMSFYALISILIPLVTPTLSSLPRFILPIFPIFILIALFKNRSILLFYQIISIMLLSAFAILFINGYWVS